MNKYFSKLAKRTGIAVNSAGNIRRQTARVNIGSAFQPDKRVALKRGLEANVEKIVESAGPQGNSVTESSISKDSRLGFQSPAEKDVLTSVSSASPEESEFSVREHDPSQFIKADSVKKDTDDDSAEVRANIPEMTVHAHVLQPEILKGADQQSRNMPEGDNQPPETSSEPTAVKNNQPDNVLLIEKQQYIASPDNRAPRHNQFDKSELNPGLEIPISERQPKSEEKTIETNEKKRPHRGTRTIHIVSERGRTAETNVEKAGSPAHDNSVAIHIGTISFEVHQAPEKKTVTVPPPPVPRPVVIQQTHTPKTPRLSRYYLRGM